MPTANRGFGSMSKERRAEISAMGGRASAIADNGCHKWTKQSGATAGRAGGLASAKAKKLKKAAADAPVITLGGK